MSEIIIHTQYIDESILKNITSKLKGEKSFTKKKNVYIDFLSKIVNRFSFDTNFHRYKSNGKLKIPNKILLEFSTKRKFHFNRVIMNIIGYSCKKNLKQILLFVLNDLAQRCKKTKEDIRLILEKPNDSGYTNYMLAGENVSILKFLWNNGARNLDYENSYNYNIISTLLFSKKQIRDIAMIEINNTNVEKIKNLQRNKINLTFKAIKWIFSKLNSRQRNLLNIDIGANLVSNISKYPFYKEIYFFLILNMFPSNSYPIKLSFDLIKFILVPIGINYNKQEVYKVTAINKTKEHEHIYLWLNFNEDKFEWIVSTKLGSSDFKYLLYRSSTEDTFKKVTDCSEWYDRKNSLVNISYSLFFNSNEIYLENCKEYFKRYNLEYPVLISYNIAFRDYANIYYANNIRCFVRKLYFSKSTNCKNLIKDFYNKYQNLVPHDEEIKSIFDWPINLVPNDIRSFVQFIKFNEKLNSIPNECKYLILEFYNNVSSLSYEPIIFKYFCTSNYDTQINFKISDYLNSYKFRIFSILNEIKICHQDISVIKRIKFKLNNLISRYLEKKRIVIDKINTFYATKALPDERIPHNCFLKFKYLQDMLKELEDRYHTNDTLDNNSQLSTISEESFRCVIS